MPKNEKAISEIRDLIQRSDSIKDQDPKAVFWRSQVSSYLGKNFGSEMSFDFSDKCKEIDTTTKGRKRSAIVQLDFGRNFLEELIDAIQDGFAEPLGKAPVAESAPNNATGSQKIFIVHGHDDAARDAVARSVTALGLEPVILHEQPNRGATIIEKFEKHADVDFAIIIVTPDDVGRAKDDDTLRDRARQNVILELGYFVGRLGRDRVMVLRKGHVEDPSDFTAVVWQELDCAGAWKLKLGQELKDAEYNIDLNRLA